VDKTWELLNRVNSEMVHPNPTQVKKEIVILDDISYYCTHEFI